MAISSDSFKSEELESLRVENDSLKCQLNKLKNEIEELKKKCKCVALEKKVRRYKAKIAEILNSRAGDSDKPLVGEKNDFGSEDNSVICDGTETTEELLLLIENQRVQIELLCGDLNLMHLRYEETLESLFSETEYHARKSKESEELVNELLKNHEKLMGELQIMHEEYKKDVKKNPEIATSSGQAIVAEFKGLPSTMQGFMTACIAVISKICPFGWSFIKWLWPRLLAAVQFLFSKRQQFVSLIRCMNSLVNTAPFQRFTRAWGEGKPLDDCLSHLTKTEFLNEVMRVGPQILKHVMSFGVKT